METFFSNILAAFAWPLAVFATVIALADDISSLLKRTKSFEMAGAKSEFADYAAVFGYVGSKVGKLTDESSPAEWLKIKEEIIRVSAPMKGLHPISLGPVHTHSIVTVVTEKAPIK